ncbi:MAG: hypothetical protein WKG52_18245 [Variovorax sp.]
MKRADMKVLCEACGAENRVQAMFCRGCAHKLPGFVATGPSALESMKSWRPAQASAPAAGPPPGLLPIETRGFWIRFVLLSVAITVAFLGWHAYVTRKVDAPEAPLPVEIAATPARSAPAAPAAPAAVADEPAAALVPIDRVPLQPAITVQPAAPTQRVQSAPPAQALRPVPPVRPVQPVEPSQPVRPALPIEEPQAAVAEAAPPPPAVPARRPVVRSVAADPRPGCAHLHFILASRCEAVQCAKPAFERHPHCDKVRDQRRRDEARRNLPF